MLFSNDGKTPYTEAQVIQKAYSVVLLSAIYIDYCKEWRENHVIEQTLIGFKNVFADDYHYLKLTQNLSTGNTGYQSVNAVTPYGNITSALDNL